MAASCMRCLRVARVASLLWPKKDLTYVNPQAAFASADATLTEDVAFEPCDSIDPLAQSFVRLVLNKERADRPNLSAMKSHPYFTSM